MTGRSAIFAVSLAGFAVVALVAGCSSDYSPNTYNSSAVQQANKTEQGVVVGVRQVDVTASGTTGAVVGGAAGGIAGSQVGNGATSAFGALGGSLVGGLIGIGAEHAAGDTTAYEYIVRKTNKELVSVTQKGDPPLAIGEHVLVIAGAQARIVPDYTVTLPPETPEPAKDAPRQPVEQTPLAPPAGTAAPAAAPVVPVPTAGSPVLPAVSAAPAAGAPVIAVPTTAPVPAAAAEVTRAIEAPAASPVVPVQPPTIPGVPANLVPTLLTPAPTAKPATD
jgi:outer membrane lipoprotein SlyB